VKSDQEGVDRAGKRLPRLSSLAMRHTIFALAAMYRLEDIRQRCVRASLNLPTELRTVYEVPLL